MSWQQSQPSGVGNLGILTCSILHISHLSQKKRMPHMSDFRPISLVHSFAKLITKILANRLAGKLDQLVSPNQSAFIKGRFIQDNFMLVQQTARHLHQQKQARLLLKLDITKAFDSVCWKFWEILALGRSGVILSVVFLLLPLHRCFSMDLLGKEYPIREDWDKGTHCFGNGCAVLYGKKGCWWGLAKTSC